MFSDNGTKFKGADAKRKSLVMKLDDLRINQSAANKGVTWRFDPPLAPHFGGVHETMIKSAKKAIQAILGNADITDEELMTTMIGPEALINSRPLTFQSANPADDVPVRPTISFIDRSGASLLLTRVTISTSTLGKGGAEYRS